MNPVTGQFLGRTRPLAIGTIVPNTGNPTNGAVPGGPGHRQDRPTPGRRSAFAPRFGMAYDVTGAAAARAARRRRPVLRPAERQLDLRAGPESADLENVTVRYGAAADARQRRLTTEAPPALNVFEYDSELPSSVQWNGGVQMTLPWAIALDVAYVGQHSYNIARRT